MKITQGAEYGIHCAAYIAEQMAKGAKLVTARELAEAQAIPIDYTRQILQKLKQASLIETVRGPCGGYRLARPAVEITLADILHATEGDTFEIICEHKPISPSRCATSAACNLRLVWYRLHEQIEEFLQGYTLQDLLNLSVEQNSPVQIRLRKNAYKN